MVAAAEGDQGCIGVIATVLATDDVVHVEMVAEAASWDAALVHVTRENAASLPGGERRRRSRAVVVDVTHDRRVAEERVALGVIELDAVRERVAIGRDPDLRWRATRTSRGASDVARPGD